MVDWDVPKYGSEVIVRIRILEFRTLEKIKTLRKDENLHAIIGRSTGVWDMQKEVYELGVRS